MKNKILGVRLTEKTKVALSQHADKKGITPSNYVRILIEKALKNVR